jgi:hypothetical protein
VFVDGFINGMLEIQVDIIGPEGGAKLLASDKSSIVFEQERENLGRLGFKSNTPSCLTQLKVEWVEPKVGKYCYETRAAVEEQSVSPEMSVKCNYSQKPLVFQ